MDEQQRISKALALKFMFSKKATKIDKIFTLDLTLCSKCQIDGEDFFNLCGLLRKHELYFPTYLFFFEFIKFVFSKKATKINEIVTAKLTLTT